MWNFSGVDFSTVMFSRKKAMYSGNQRWKALDFMGYSVTVYNMSSWCSGSCSTIDIFPSLVGSVSDRVGKLLYYRIIVRKYPNLNMAQVSKQRETMPILVLLASFSTQNAYTHRHGLLGRDQ